MSYEAFLASKRREWTGTPIPTAAEELPDGLYPFQAALTRWALRKGRAAIFADTGLGKTRMQIAWASRIPGRVLVLAPLCVGSQTSAEAARLGVDVRTVGSGTRIEITNYERLHQIDPAVYTGVVLDESSILKAFDGKTRSRLIAAFQATPYRLCCTATPAPNDIAELANHCEFLGIMTRPEMLATFFVHDEDGWRLKGHAHEAFYRWLASWGMFVRRPSDLGFDDAGYDLPPLEIRDRIVPGDGPAGEYLFPGMGLGGLKGRSLARRQSLKRRVDAAIALVEGTTDQIIVWCGLNVREARADDDDRHICPLQLGTIERCVRLWSNPGEVVLSPFAGIGSEGYEAIRLGRHFVGVELKREYFDAAATNLRHAETSATAQTDLFVS